MENLTNSKVFAIIILLFFTVSCSDDDAIVVVPPVVTNETTETDVVTTLTSIEISGKVTESAGSTITARGVAWGTSPSPTIDNNITIESTNIFTSTITDLLPNTTYYFRVYATYSGGNGTSYGEELIFSTLSLDETEWDFLIVFDANTSWHADVIFYKDGTTYYDEPEFPGLYTTYGTWSSNGNVISYNLDSSSGTDYYFFTGTIEGNSMAGTFNWGDDEPKVWTAILK